VRMVFASLSPGNAHAGKAFRMSASGVKYIIPKIIVAYKGKISAIKDHYAPIGRL
jgi:hypothetical protein